jgi:hypothetical protein
LERKNQNCQFSVLQNPQKTDGYHEKTGKNWQLSRNNWQFCRWILDSLIFLRTVVRYKNHFFDCCENHGYEPWEPPW